MKRLFSQCFCLFLLAASAGAWQIDLPQWQNGLRIEQPSEEWLQCEIENGTFPTPVPETPRRLLVCSLRATNDGEFFLIPKEYWGAFYCKGNGLTVTSNFFGWQLFDTNGSIVLEKTAPLFQMRGFNKGTLLLRTTWSHGNALDVTTVPDGNYRLRFTIDPRGYFTTPASIETKIALAGRTVVLAEWPDPPKEDPGPPVTREEFDALKKVVEELKSPKPSGIIFVPNTNPDAAYPAAR